MKSTSPRSRSRRRTALPPTTFCAARCRRIRVIATALAWILVFLTAGTLSAAVVTFEDLPLAPDSYWNGDDGSGGFVSGDASFTNRYDMEWGFWEGFACSNLTDANGIGYSAQYNAIPGGGQGGSTNYAVAFVGWTAPPTVVFARLQSLTGLYVTNNCYAYHEMREGSPFSKKFGGDTGDDPDWFKLTITGVDANDQPIGTVEFYLADFRFEDNARDYILDSWAFVDLASLGPVQALQFAVSSSDTGDFGMNTPAYFCLDTILPQVPIATFEDLTLDPESHWNGADGSGQFVSGQASFTNLYNADYDYWEGFAYSNHTDANTAGYTSQYNAICGGGQGGTAHYAVGFVGWEIVPTLTFDNPQTLTGLYLTNTCYAYYEMREGSPFSKKFGGQTGNEPDWFKLTITGIDAGGRPTGEVEFYLADFRFENNACDYILDSWAFVDLTSLGEVETLCFTLSSSDTGDFGMNNPAYFCLDTIVSGVATHEQAIENPVKTFMGDDPCVNK